MSLESSQNTEQLPPLSEKEVLRIIWKSFEFSQGSIENQKLILHKIRGYYATPSEIDEESLQTLFHEKVNSIPVPQTLYKNDGHDKIKEKENTHILADINSHAKVKATSMLADGDIKPYIAILSSAETLQVSVMEIVRNIWKSDWNYFNSGGRPNRDDTQNNANTLKDSFFSFGIHYILNKNETTPASFNRLVHELQAVPFETYDFDTLSYAIKTISKYNQTHQDTSVPSELYSSLEAQLVTRSTPDTE